MSDNGRVLVFSNAHGCDDAVGERVSHVTFRVRGRDGVEHTVLTGPLQGQHFSDDDATTTLSIDLVDGAGTTRIQVSLAGDQPRLLDIIDQGLKALAAPDQGEFQ